MSWPGADVVTAPPCLKSVAIERDATPPAGRVEPPVLQGLVHAVRRYALPVAMELLDQPLASAEFLAVDTETNGRAGEECELTEVGAVLVGGGELHDRWGSLVTVSAPLSRGIQRFTGITQGMVDTAPPAAVALAELAALMRGRTLVAHSAGFDRRVLGQAFERPLPEAQGPRRQRRRCGRVPARPQDPAAIRTPRRQASRRATRAAAARLGRVTRRSRRLPVPGWRRAGALRGQVGLRAHARPLALHALVGLR